MSVKQARALVLTGDGINSEEETALALRLAGFQTDIRHLNDLIAEKFSFDSLSSRYGVLALPASYLPLRFNMAWGGICSSMRIGVDSSSAFVTVFRR
jgi:hypothetical protein